MILLQVYISGSDTRRMVKCTVLRQFILCVSLGSCIICIIDYEKQKSGDVHIVASCALTCVWCYIKEHANQFRG